MTKEDAARKVRALLATAAESSGATPAERDTARRLAARLMAAHDLTEQEIPVRQVQRQAPPPAPRPQDVTIVVHVGGFSFGGFSYSFSDSTNSTSGW